MGFNIIITILRQMNAFNTCWYSKHGVITEINSGRGIITSLKLLLFTFFTQLNAWLKSLFWHLVLHLLKELLVRSLFQTMEVPKSCVHKSFNSFSAAVDPNPELKSIGFRLGNRHCKKRKYSARKSLMCPYQLKMSLLELTHDNMEVNRSTPYKSQQIADWAGFKLYI